MPAEIHALIFDMDGVIVDSNPLHRAAWTEYSRRYGVETTEAMQTRMYGRRNDEIVRDFLGSHLTDAEVLEHGAAKERVYRELMGPRLAEAIVPGLREFIARQAATYPKLSPPMPSRPMWISSSMARACEIFLLLSSMAIR